MYTNSKPVFQNEISYVKVHDLQMVGKAHPNVYEFVEVMQKEQTAVELFFTQS